MMSTSLIVGIFIGIFLVVVFQFMQKNLRSLTSPGCLMLLTLIVLGGFGFFYFMTQTGVQ